MRQRVVAKLGEESDARIDVIHNWADGEKSSPAEAATNPFSSEHGLDGHFVVLFSGNLGRVNEFSTVLESARRLRGQSDIVFLFIGEGACLKAIKDYSAEHHLSNIRTLPYQPRESVPLVLAAGQALLVTLAEGLAGLSVPSKSYAIMAAGRPLLFVGDLKSDIARIVSDNRCGAVVASGDSDGLARLIKRWAADACEVDRLGRAARSLFEESFDRRRAVTAYINSFSKCVSSAPQPLRQAFGARRREKRAS
jgi:glycosyltransferase involved in cell wall biosynthesis